MGALVSLVITDIVGSTRRWAADDTAMAADLELHDRLIREVVESATGRVFKHTGDGMIAAFDDPVAAVSTAAAIQQVIGTTTWQHPDGLQVRAAVHSGVVYERDGDMFGTAVNKVARILGICPPGAVLVSNAIAALLTERHAPGLSTAHVGDVELAGFAAAEAVHALEGVGLVEVGPLGSLVRHSQSESRLPPIDDELIGRSEELAAIWDALQRSHLVTLIGVGGMGKTRLGLEVAAGSVDTQPGGVWWIDLSNATSADFVLPVALDAVGGRETPGRTMLQAITDRLGGEALVVVDNCEHVLSAARQLITAVRTAAPTVRVVATSREALDIRGEQIIPVGSLGADEGDALFVERALAVRPDLDIDSNRDVIANITARLNGIPLAIELAAARCRSMTPGEIDARLDDRFRLLRGGRSGAERHRTLQAAVAWSYSMLDDDERAVFHALAVFAGGTLIDGLTAVSGFDEFDVLDIVDRLVARSMVVATTTPLGSRYHELETLRQFAEDRLAGNDELRSTERRHLNWMVDLARSIAATMGTSHASAGLARFRAEVDNLRAAVNGAVDSGDHAIAQTLVGDIARFAYSGQVHEVFDWVRPLHLGDEWSEHAALCAAYGDLADEHRRGLLGRRYPIGGVPEQFLHTSAQVMRCQAMNLVTCGGDWRTVLALAEHFADSDRLSRCLVGTAVIHANWLKAAEGVSHDEYEQLVRHAAEVRSLASQLGDDLISMFAYQMSAYLLGIARPAEAVELAKTAIEFANRYGGSYAIAAAKMVLQQSLAASVAAGELPAAEVAHSLRSQLAAAIDQRITFFAWFLAVIAAGVLVRTDPDLAALMAVAYEQHSGTRAELMLAAVHASVAFDRSALEQRLVETTIDAVVGEVVSALDRVIAAGGVG